MEKAERRVSWSLPIHSLSRYVSRTLLDEDAVLLLASARSLVVPTQTTRTTLICRELQSTMNLNSDDAHLSAAYLHIQQR